MSIYFRTPDGEVLEESVLLERFRAGDRDSFLVIWEDLSKPLKFFVENVIGTSPDVENIVDDSFFALFGIREDMRSLEEIRRALFSKAIQFLLDRGYPKLNGVDIETERAKAIIFYHLLSGGNKNIPPKSSP